LSDGTDATPKKRGSLGNRLLASRKFQSWAAQFPLTRRLVRKEGAAMFDLLAGFCHSQVLMALVQLDLLETIREKPATLDALAQQTGVPEPRMEVLLRAAVALRLLKHKSRGRYALTRSGAALLGVPGLTQMIAHHDVLYRDLADPAAFFRGEVDTELARFWPYVFGGDMDPDVAATYSDLMAESQVLVAEDTLRTVSCLRTAALFIPAPSKPARCPRGQIPCRSFGCFMIIAMRRCQICCPNALRRCPQTGPC